MATSGYSDVYVTKWDTLRFSWDRSGYSIASNTSTINWSLELISTSYGAINSSPARAWSVNVNGISYNGSISVNIDNNTTKTLASGSTDIVHNNDGTKTFAYSFSQTFNITFSGNYIGTINGSSTGTLESIPRYSEMTSATDFTDEGNPTLYFTNPTDGYFHLRAKIEAGGNTKLIFRDIDSTSTSYTFSLTEDERKTLRRLATSNTLDVRLTICCTDGGEAEYSASFVDKTMTIVNGTPTLNPTVIDTNTISTTLTGDPNKLILHYNTTEVAFNAVALKEASITSKRAVCGNAVLMSDGVMSHIENGTFIFSITDSRGNTATKTITKDIIDYIPLTCNLYVDSDLVDGSAVNLQLNISGKYFAGSFGAVMNSLALEYRYKINNGNYPTDDDGNDAWTPLTNTPTIANSGYTAQETLTGLDYRNAYTVQVRAKDAIYNALSEPAKVAEYVVKIVPIFDWSDNDFNFNVPITIQGSPLADFVVEQGISGIWTYVKYYSGRYEAWYQNEESDACVFTDNLDNTIDTYLSPSDHYNFDLPSFSKKVLNYTGVASCRVAYSWGLFWLEEMDGVLKFRVRIATFGPIYDAVTNRINLHIIGEWKE